MAITNAAKVGNQIPFGKEYTGEARIECDLDNSYPLAAGYAGFVSTIVQSIAGLEHVTPFDVPCQLVTDGAGVWLLSFYDADHDILRFIDPTTGQECTNGQDLSAFIAIQLVVRYY